MARTVEIENLIVDDLVKGVPGGVDSFPLRELSTKGWNVLAKDLPLTVAMLMRSALFQNVLRSHEHLVSLKARSM